MFINEHTIDVSFSSSVNDPKLLFDIYAFENICLKSEKQANECANESETGEESKRQRENERKKS